MRSSLSNESVGSWKLELELDEAKNKVTEIGRIALTFVEKVLQWS